MYATMDDWLNEIEGFSVRAERVPAEAMPWIETAWTLATKAEREACARLAESRVLNDQGSEDDECRRIAAAIRNR